MRRRAIVCGLVAATALLMVVPLDSAIGAEVQKADINVTAVWTALRITGEPPGLTITVTPPNGRIEEYQNEYLEVKAAIGRWKVVWSAPGYASQEEIFEITGMEDKLEKSRTLKALGDPNVTLRITGQPSDVSIDIVDPLGTQIHRQGEYWVSGATVGDWHVTWSAPGYETNSEAFKIDGSERSLVFKSRTLKRTSASYSTESSSTDGSTDVVRDTSTMPSSSSTPESTNGGISSRHKWGWGLTAAGVGLLATGVGLHWHFYKEAKAAVDSSDRGRYDSSRTWIYVTYAMYGVSAGLLAGGIALLVTGNGEASAEHDYDVPQIATGLAPVAGPDMIGCAWAMTF